MGIVVGADGDIGEFNIEVLRQVFGVFLDLLALNVGEVIEQDADLVLGGRSCIRPVRSPWLR